jgi:hypothetical protein
MSLPAKARVRAAHSFARNLGETYRFLIEQDASTAATRFANLQGALADARSALASNPSCGRPARFLRPHSLTAQLKARRVLDLAAQAGLPSLREFVTGKYVLLYAHSDTDVMLLALKHERQLEFHLQHDT